MTTNQLRSRLNLSPVRSTSMRYRVAFLALALSALPCGLAFGATAKPLATCNDGKTEYSETGDHRGACSGHGGVKAWASGEPVKSKHKATSYR